MGTRESNQKQEQVRTINQYIKATMLSTLKNKEIET